MDRTEDGARLVHSQDPLADLIQSGCAGGDDDDQGPRPARRPAAHLMPAPYRLVTAHPHVCRKALPTTVVAGKSLSCRPRGEP